MPTQKQFLDNTGLTELLDELGQYLKSKLDKLTVGDGVAIDNNDTIRTTGIPFGRCDSTSTATEFTATVPGIYKLEDGVCCMIDNGVVTSASGFTLNVNGLGDKPVYTNLAAATRDTTIFNINYTMLFVYDETRVSGGCWICYRGYDSNTNTIGYQLRTNSTVRNVSDTARYYKIYFTSADGTKWVPASVNSTNNATSARPVNQRPIDPFGRIVYTSANTNYAAGANLAATTVWDQYNLTLGYSFNRTGAALTLTAEASVYLKCAPLTDGSAIMDADTPIVQTLPTTNDGKIYIFLGVATSATAIELVPHHPVYYHDGTGIRIWTGKDSYSKSEVDAVLSGKQNNLTFDTTPTANSTNPVTSGGIKTALDGKLDALVSGTNIKTVNNTSLLGSGNVDVTEFTELTAEEGMMLYSKMMGGTISDQTAFNAMCEKISAGLSVGKQIRGIITSNNLTSAIISVNGVRYSATHFMLTIYATLWEYTRYRASFVKENDNWGVTRTEYISLDNHNIGENIRYEYDSSMDQHVFSAVDEKVAQAASSENIDIPLLLASGATPGTAGAKYDADFKFNPSTNTLKVGTGTLTATNYSGNAATATSDSLGNNISETYATKSEVENNELVTAAALSDLYNTKLNTSDFQDYIIPALGNKLDKPIDLTGFIYTDNLQPRLPLTEEDARVLTAEEQEMWDAILAGVTNKSEFTLFGRLVAFTDYLGWDISNIHTWEYSTKEAVMAISINHFIDGNDEKFYLSMPNEPNFYVFSDGLKTINNNSLIGSGDITVNEIASISTVESSVSGGNNIVTITDTNGNLTSFSVKNGADGVSLGEIALVQTTGDSEESVMSQKAVTDELFFDYSMNAYDDVIWETGLINTSNGKNGTNDNQQRTQGYLDLGVETTSVTIETNGEFYAFFYNENDGYLGYRYLNKTSVEVTKTIYPTMRKVRFCSTQNYRTKYYRKNLIIKCSHYELLPTAVKQTTGASFDSLMSQKAITDAINRNINVVNCSCGFLASSNTYRIKLTDEQYDALQNTDVMSITIVMTEPENAYSASMTLRYVNVYGNGSAASTSNGFLIEWDYNKRMFCAHKNYNTATCVNKTSGGTIINPLVFTIIWDKAEGTVRYYERATLISTQTYDEYKISNFVSSDKTISVNGGDTAIYLYDLQIFNDDISKRGFSLYQNTIYGASYVYAKYDGNINTTAVDWITTNGDWSTYGTASGFTCTYPGDGTCVITSSGSTAWLNRGYYLGSSTQIQRWEVDIEVISGECKVSSNGQVITAIIDGNGDNHASGSLLGVGTYTIKGYSDGTGKWRIAYGSGDLKVIHYRNRYKYVSCVVHLKCDNYYDGALYDEQGKCFYDFNTTLKPNSTPFTLPRTTTNNPPNYAGQMAIPSNGNIYIGTKNYVWKQINNS